MTNLTKMPLPLLVQNTAMRWKLTAHDCPECHGAIYENQILAPLGLAYTRCPLCQVNYIKLLGTPLIDKIGDQMLDELALRSPLISHPRHTAKNRNPV